MTNKAETLDWKLLVENEFRGLTEKIELHPVTIDTDREFCFMVIVGWIDVYLLP